MGICASNSTTSSATSATSATSAKGTRKFDFSVASGALRTAKLKVDHFQGIARLPSSQPGAPNLRRLPHAYHIVGTGQPTLSALQRLLEAEGCAQSDAPRALWFCLRQEPVVYVGDMSFTPRDAARLNEHIPFDGVQLPQLTRLQDQLVDSIKERAGGTLRVEYFQDTYAENPADRENVFSDVEIASLAEIRSLAEAYEYLNEQGLNVELVRLPIADERPPGVHDLDTIVEKVQSVDPDVPLFFNCQMGKGRTTTGQVCACLVRRGLLGEHAPVISEADKDHPRDKQVQDAPESERMGWFPIISRLTKALSNGPKAKHVLDEVLDMADHMQNLRESIVYAKQHFDRETPERRGFWAHMACNFIERYFVLICFSSYVLDYADGGFATPFSTWWANHSLLFDTLGAEQAFATFTADWE